LGIRSGEPRLAFEFPDEYVSTSLMRGEEKPMKRFVTSLILLTSMSIFIPQFARAQAYEPYLGEIQTFAFTFCPTGWAPLNGQLLSISQNEALFTLIGTLYGGNGTTTFALPKWGPIYTANGQKLTPCIALQGVFPSQN